MWSSENVPFPFVSSERAEGQIGSITVEAIHIVIGGVLKPLSANLSARGPAAAALYQVCTKPEARTEWSEQIDDSHALGLFNDAGHGLIVDGTPEEILAYIDQVHAHVHQKLG